MPTITIRLSEDDKLALETAASGADKSLSEYVREALQLQAAQGHRIADTLELLDKRIARLEEMAGL